MGWSLLQKAFPKPIVLMMLQGREKGVREKINASKEVYVYMSFLTMRIAI